MSDSNKKDIVIKMFDITDGMERAEKEANYIVSQGYELFSSTMASILGNWMCKLILIFKKKKD